MAYEVHAISAITEVPALAGTFAASVGFTTDLSTPTQPIISAPVDSNSASFEGGPEGYPIHWRLRATTAGVFHRLWAEYEDYLGVYGDLSSNSILNNLITSVAETYSPILGTPNAEVQLPVRVHFVGAMEPQPYLGIIVEYENVIGNMFRHLYVGRMEKIGQYIGGDVISATKGPFISSQTTLTYKNYDHMQYLFESRQNHSDFGQCGGVFIDAGSSNDYLWRKFRGNDSLNPMTAMPDNAVIGGFGDDINDGYLARARSPFAGQSILVPINLYAVENIVGDCNFRPIGRPAGIRMVNMQDLTPGSEIVVGGFEWRVFPSHRRSSATAMAKPSGAGSGNYYRAIETSHWVGYAYAVGQEDSNSAGA